MRSDFFFFFGGIEFHLFILYVSAYFLFGKLLDSFSETLFCFFGLEDSDGVSVATKALCWYFW